MKKIIIMALLVSFCTLPAQALNELYRAEPSCEQRESAVARQAAVGAGEFAAAGRGGFEEERVGVTYAVADAYVAFAKWF